MQEADGGRHAVISQKKSAAKEESTGTSVSGAAVPGIWGKVCLS